MHESGLTTGEQKRAIAHLRATCPISRSNGATAVKVSIAAICALVLRAPPTAADSVDRNTSALTTPVLNKIEPSTNDWPHICMAAGGKLLQWRSAQLGDPRKRRLFYSTFFAGYYLYDPVLQISVL